MDPRQLSGLVSLFHLSDYGSSHELTKLHRKEHQRTHHFSTISASALLRRDGEASPDSSMPLEFLRFLGQISASGAAGA